MKSKRYMRNQITGVLALIGGLLAMAAQSLFGGNSRYIAAANTYDSAVLTHGPTLSRTNDAAITARHLLWADGATAGTTVALATATTVALGTIDNEETNTGLTQAVLMLGRGDRTKKMVASEEMAAVGVRVFQAAGGKVALTGVICVGILRSISAADGSVVEVDDCKPRIEPNGVNAVAGGTLAIPVTKRVVAKTTGGAEALTLANGLPGQRLHIYLAADGGDGTLTPTTKTGFTAIVFADVKDSVDLQYIDDTVGWIVTGSAGVPAPPVLT
ncbi:MAG: hypothetical protein V4662_17715 [Verrucomicrobiota bacterium]